MLNQIFFSLSIKGDSYEIYKGDRTKEEIIGFALRMAATPVPHLDSSHLEHAIKDHSLFFLYSGLREGELWVIIILSVFFVYKVLSILKKNFFIICYC